MPRTPAGEHAVDSADTSVTTDLRNSVGIGTHFNLDRRAHWEGVVTSVDRDGVGPYWNLSRKGTAGIDSHRTDNTLALRELDAALHRLRLAVGIAGLLDWAGGAGERVAADSAVRAALRAGGATADDQRHGGHNDQTTHVDLDATVTATVPDPRETGVGELFGMVGERWNDCGGDRGGVGSCDRG